MIQILPMEDRQEEKELLDGLETVGGETRVLEMTDRGKTAGRVAVELSGGALRILKLWAQGYDFSRKPVGEEAFVLDTLVRSAASYGESLGADRIETAFPDFYGFFAALGFTDDVDAVRAPMSVIVHYETPSGR